MSMTFAQWWDGASPSVSEAFVGEFVRLALPAIFPRHDPVGSDAHNRPTRASFDFQYLGPDGRIAVLETTTLTRPSDTVRHVEQKITAVAASPVPVGAFVYVARCPRPPIETVARWHAELVELGVDPERIVFYFRDEVVRELEQPRYEGLKRRYGMHAATRPFDRLDDVDWANRLGPLAPSVADLARQEVPAPQQATVTDLLSTRSGAAIAGPVGVGKTLLALRVANALGDQPDVYYLDIAEIGAGSAKYKASIVEQFADLQSADVLIVIDNAQAGRELMADVVRIWRRTEDRCRLLVITSHAHPGREPSDDTLLWGVLPIVRMTVSRETLTATARQVLARRGAADLVPEPAAVDQWLASFEDLSAFAHAIDGAPLARLRHGDWRLAPSDAVDRIRDRYVGAHPERRSDLALLAVAGVQNVYVPGSLLRDKDALAGEGLIFEANLGRRVDLVLCGLGTASTSRLVLDALDLTESERTGVLAELAVRAPSTAGLLAVRLRNTGRVAEGDALLAQTFSVGGNPWQRVLKGAGLLTAFGIARAVIDARAVPVAAIDAAFAAIDEDLLADRLWVSTLCEVCEAVSIAHRMCLRETEAVLRQIIRERLADRLAEEVLSQQSISMVWEALVAARSILPPVFSAALHDALDIVGAILAGEDTGAALGPGDISALVHLLEKIVRVAPAEHYRITRPLADPAVRGRLAEVVARVRPVAIPRLLSVLYRLDAAVAAAFANDFGEWAHVTEIARGVVAFPAVDKIPGFVANLASWGNRLPGAVRLAVRLERTLGKPKYVRLIAYRLTVAPLPEVIRVLAHDAAWVRAAAAGVNVGEWEEERGATLMNTRDLRELEKGLDRVGRLELMHAPARALLLAADATRYPQNNKMLLAIATTLRFADSVAPRELERFLVTVCQKGRLNEAYLNAAPQVIAGMLHSIWVTRGDEVVARFLTRGLRSRAEKEFASRWTGDARLWTRMSLLGVLDLVGALPVEIVPAADGFEDAFALAEPLEPKGDREQLLQRARGWRGVAVMRETYRHLKPVLDPFIDSTYGFTALAVGDRLTLRERHLVAHTFLSPRQEGDF